MNYRGTIALMMLCGMVTGCNLGSAGHIEASGTIEIIETTVSSKNADAVDKLLVDEGDSVHMGDLVAEIDHSSLDLQLAESEAALLGAKYQLELLLNGARTEDLKIAEEAVIQTEAAYENADKNFARTKELFTKGNISQKQYDDAVTGFTTAKTQYTSAQLTLKKLKSGARAEEINVARAKYDQVEAGVNILKKKIADCSVRSPVAGVVTTKFVEEGEFVNVGTPLYTVAKLDPVNLTIYVSEVELGKVTIGGGADVRIDAYPDKVFKGKIIYISPVAEFTPKSIQTKDERVKQVFGVKLEVPNPDGILKPGMPADASLLIE